MYVLVEVSTSTGGAGHAALRQLAVSCTLPVIVLPVSPRARAALCVELSRLTLHNAFRRAGESGTVSTVSPAHTGDDAGSDVPA